MQIKINPESNFTEKIGLTLGAFGLSLLLWTFVVSENEYTMLLDFPIEARNLNVLKAHKEEVPSFATVKIKGVSEVNSVNIDKFIFYLIYFAKTNYGILCIKIRINIV